MPATEETYRRQSTLNVVFAISSIAMLLTMVWMIMADHVRPWKRVQREFHQVEEAKLEVAEQLKAEEQNERYSTDLELIKTEIEEAKQTEARNRDKIREQQKKIDQFKARYDLLDTQTKFKKAELDSKRSEYDLIIDKGDKAGARSYLATVIIPTEDQYRKLAIDLENITKDLRKAEDELAELRGRIDDKIKQKEDLERDVSRIQRALAQKRAQYGQGTGFWGRSARAWPSSAACRWLTWLRRRRGSSRSAFPS